jgi:nucleotide-binding universal stress UspA family protein
VAQDEVSGSVVCGIGGRDAAARLAAVAATLAKQLGAPLTAVRVEPATPAAGDGPSATLGRARTAALRRGHALLGEVLREAEQEHAFVRRVGLGDPAAALRAAADGERARLMIVGAGSRTGPAASLGPVARELVLRASCPVLVVPHAASPPTDAPTCRPLLCTFDGSDGARPALSVAAALADRLGVLALVAHVGRASVGEVEARARTERPALIVTASCGTEGWHAAMPGSGPVRLATSGSTPVLFVPPEYRHAPVALPRVASEAGRPAKPAKASPVGSAAPAQ